MRNDIKALTGIRFLAAFYIFLLHMNMRIPFTFAPQFVRNVVEQGRAGVNVFFVLSGFILTYTYHKRNISYKEFLLKRFFRIYPAYLVGFILCLTAYMFIFLPSWKVLVANLFMVQSYFVNVVMQWYGSGSWSISTEFFFYFLFPFVIPVIKTLTLKTLRVLLAFFLITSFLPGFYASFTGHLAQWSYSFPPLRISEFICGIITGILVFRYKAMVNPLIAVLSILMLILFLGIAGNKLETTANNFIIVPVVLLCLAACSRSNSYFNWLGHRWMEYLGKISYGFYIVQIPIVLTLEGLINKGVVSRDNLIIIPVAFLFNLSLSVTCYHFVEMPIHNKYGKKRKSAPAETLVLNEA